MFLVEGISPISKNPAHCHFHQIQDPGEGDFLNKIARFPPTTDIPEHFEGRCWTEQGLWQAISPETIS